MIKIFLTIVCVNLLFGCIDKNLRAETSTFDKLYAANPVADAESAIKRREYKLIGVKSHKILVLGFDINCDIPKEMVNVLEETSHFYPNYTSAKLNAVARVYAEYYNIRMKTHFEKNGLDICSENASE